MLRPRHISQLPGRGLPFVAALAVVASTSTTLPAAAMNSPFEPGSRLLSTGSHLAAPSAVPDVSADVYYLQDVGGSSLIRKLSGGTTLTASRQLSGSPTDITLEPQSGGVVAIDPVGEAVADLVGPRVRVTRADGYGQSSTWEYDLAAAGAATYRRAGELVVTETVDGLDQLVVATDHVAERLLPDDPSAAGAGVQQRDAVLSPETLSRVSWDLRWRSPA